MPEDIAQPASEPAADYSPAPDAGADPDITFGRDHQGLRDAAAYLVQSRGDDEPPADDPETDQIEPKKRGPLSVTEAGLELSEEHNERAAAAEAADNEATAAQVDKIRAESLNQKAAELTAQLEPAPTDEAETPAPQLDAERSGLDPEIEAALANPKIRQVIETEVQSIETARQHFATVTKDATALAAAALYSGYPELRGLTAEQLPGALQAIAAQNPQRYAAVNAHIETARSLYRANAQAQQEQQQRASSHFQKFAEQQDAAFEDGLKGLPEHQVKAVRENIGRIVEKDFGISRQEMQHLLKTEPIMRTAAFQRIVFNACQHQLAQEAKQKALRVTVPQVQRPGTTAPRAAVDSDLIKHLEARLNRTGNWKDAAELHAARSGRA